MPSARNLWLQGCRNAALAAGALIALYYLLIPLLSQSHFMGLDLSRTDLGMLCELRDWISRGGNPGVARYLGAGQPLFADPQISLLYPPRWVAILLSPEKAIFFQVCFHIAVGVVGFGYLLRTFVASPRTILAGAMAYGLTGTSADYVVHTAYILDLAWLPWFWFFVRTGLRRRYSSLHLVGAAISVLLFLLGGEPQAVIGCILIGLVESASLLFRHRLEIRNLRLPLRVSALISLCACAVGIALLQWIPTFTEMKNTFRGDIGAASDALQMSFRPIEWAATLVPGLLSEFVFPGGSLGRIFWGTETVPTTWNHSPYLGFLLIALAFSSIGRRNARTPILIGLVGWILCTGNYSPIYRWMVAHVGLLTQLRFPAKYFVLVNLSWVTLATLSLDRMRKPLRKWKPQIASIAAFLAIGTAAWVWLTIHESWLDDAFATAVGPLGSILPSSFVKDALMRSLVIPGLAVLSLIRWPLARFLVPAILILDLGLANLAALPLGYGDYSPPKASLMQSLRAQEDLKFLEPLEHEIICAASSVHESAPVSRTLGFPLPAGTLDYQKFTSTPNLNVCNGERALPSYSILIPSVGPALRGMENKDENLAWARASGCTVWASEKILDSASIGKSNRTAIEWRPNPDALSLNQVYRIDQPIPYAQIIKDPFWIEDTKKLFEWIRFRSTPETVSRAVTPPPKQTADFELPNGQNLKVQSLLHDETGKFEVALQGSGGGVIALRQPFAMGWEAVQNGKKLKTVRVLAQFLGVVVLEGELGPVSIRYSIPHLKTGMALSAMSLILMIAIAIYLRKLEKENRI